MRQKGVDYSRFVGAEDPRLVWLHRTWQVVLVYGMNSGPRNARLARALWVVDLSAVHAPLAAALPPPPPRVAQRARLYRVPTEVVYDGALPPIEKNWVPFEDDGALRLSYSLAPTRLVLAVASDGVASAVTAPILTTRNLFTSAGRPVRYHQGSNAKLVRLCGRQAASKGSSRCARRYLMLWHSYPTYESYLATFLPRPPYEVDAVQSLLHLDRCVARATRTYRLPAPTKTFPHARLAHIYMSSLELVRAEGKEMQVMIGIGVNDESSWVLSLPLRVLLPRYPMGNPSSARNATGTDNGRDRARGQQGRMWPKLRAKNREISHSTTSSVPTTERKPSSSGRPGRPNALSFAMKGPCAHLGMSLVGVCPSILGVEHAVNSVLMPDWGANPSLTIPGTELLSVLHASHPGTTYLLSTRAMAMNKVRCPNPRMTVQSSQSAWDDRVRSRLLLLDAKLQTLHTADVKPFGEQLAGNRRVPFQPEDMRLLSSRQHTYASFTTPPWDLGNAPSHYVCRVLFDGASATKGGSFQLVALCH